MPVANITLLLKNDLFMKKMLFYIFVLTCVVACENTANENHSSSKPEKGSKQQTENPINPSGFKIMKGTNLSHWMSQVFGWSPREKFITQNDIKLIAELGFDHVRLPIDEENLWDEDGAIIDSSLQDLTSCLGWCMESGLRVVVDLHILRSHHFNSRNNEGAMTLWTDTLAQEKFIDLWRNLSSYLKHYPDSMVAYEPMNEPVAPEHEMWNELITKCIKEIRNLEPNRVIVLGSNRWQKPFTYPYLEIPQGDKNIILSYHSYHPYFLTHYKAYWSPAKDYDGPVVYPGVLITEDAYQQYVDTTNKPLVDRLAEEKATEFYDKNVLQKIAQPAINKAKEYGLQLYCNEFGCLPNIPDSVRQRYYSDIKTVFKENGIAFANWDYKGDFGIRKWNRTEFVNEEVDTAIVRILISE